MTMIERVAWALFKFDYPDDDGEMEALFWDRKGCAYLDQARAAVGEMRVPTESMLVAGARNRTAVGRFFNGDDTLEPEWAAMIDAALQEQ